MLFLLLLAVISVSANPLPTPYPALFDDRSPARELLLPRGDGEVPNFSRSSSSLANPNLTLYQLKSLHGNFPFHILMQLIRYSMACQASWSSISSCASACDAFEDTTQILWNPVAFINVIQCACGDTFRGASSATFMTCLILRCGIEAFPQCVDCFGQTDQSTKFLNVGAEKASVSFFSS